MSRQVIRRLASWLTNLIEIARFLSPMYRRISPPRGPPTVEPPIARVALKYNRAYEQFKALHKEVGGWIDRNGETPVTERNAEGTEYALVLKLREIPGLERWAVITGDILFNLRCTLDHLVYALAVEKSGKNPPEWGHRLQFPIADTKDDWDDAIRGHRLDGISDEALTFIKSEQPYNGGNKILSVLRSLSDIDKHRTLNLVALNVTGGTAIIPTDGSPREFTFWVNDAPLEKETTLARIKHSKPSRDPGVKFTLSLTISFWERPQRGEDFIKVLWDIFREVHRISWALAPDSHRPVTP